MGTSATFAPLLADTSHWFTRRRGIAVAIFACGSYLAGSIWPPVVELFAGTVGWRQTYLGIGIFCLGRMPGRASLLANKYYAHPCNAFWLIIFTAGGVHGLSLLERSATLLVSLAAATWAWIVTADRLHDRLSLCSWLQ